MGRLTLRVACAPLVGIAVLLTGLLLTSGEVGDEEGLVKVAETPLFERRLQEMATQFDIGAAQAAHRPTTVPERQMAPVQQALLFPSEGVSGCVVSVCVMSGCGGSACVASGCGASLCDGTACAGSDCTRCSSEATPPDAVLAVAGGRGFCALDDGEAAGSLSIAGFELDSTAHGTEIRFAASGGKVERYRVYRSEPSGPYLVAEGSASSDRLIRIIDRAPDEARGGGHRYTLELTDVHGRTTETALSEDPLQAAARSLDTRRSL